MSDSQATADVRSGMQDTGNPVLDSVVNLFCSRPRTSIAELKNIHPIVLELAKQEPGGLKRRSTNGVLQDAE